MECDLIKDEPWRLSFPLSYMRKNEKEKEMNKLLKEINKKDECYLKTI